MARTYQAYSVKAPLQNKFQAMAVRLAKAKALAARAAGEVDRIRKEFYDLADECFGPGTYFIYEARAPLEHNRMSRQMQEPRNYDVEAMRVDPRIPALAFATITKTVIDLPMLDANLKRKGFLDHRAIAEHCTYGQRPNLCWEPTGAASDIKLLPGQIAVVSSEHPVHAQEGV